MNDPVDRILVDREAMDRGFPAGVILSIAAHVALVGGSLLFALLAPAKPLINVADGMAVPLPPGGGGKPNVEPPAPAPQAPEPPPTVAPEPPKPEPEPVKPQVIKPPKEEPKKGLPEPDAKPQKMPTPTPTPARTGGVAGGTGTGSQPQGLELAPPGPGVPGGTDPTGDWYLAGVQRKIWVLWAQQIRTGMTEPAVVSFTILADGSVTDVQVVQSCGVALLDRAAQRAVLSAAPFGPLPRNYGTNQFTIQGIFKPGT